VKGWSESAVKIFMNLSFSSPRYYSRNRLERLGKTQSHDTQYVYGIQTIEYLS